MAATRKPVPRPKRDTRQAWHASLDKVLAEATKAFPGHAGKLDQLRFHIVTAQMVVDELHDTTPHELPTT